MITTIETKTKNLPSVLDYFKANRKNNLFIFGKEGKKIEWK